MSAFIENQNWRYAVKKYDASRSISPEDLETLKKAIRYSVSSFGLQPYRVLVITDKDLREKLKTAAFGQTQITDAAVVFVFANILDFGDNEVEAFVRNIAQTRDLPLETLSGLDSYVKSSVNSRSIAERNTWTSKQTYIALGNLLAAAAELKIDATPMEGFVAKEFDAILGLTEKGLSASVIAVAGYRSPDDAAQHNKKVRKSNEELFITI